MQNRGAWTFRLAAQRKKKRAPAVVEPEEAFDLYDIELPETDSDEAAEI